jgi:hypothetical protein
MTIDFKNRIGLPVISTDRRRRMNRKRGDERMDEEMDWDVLYSNVQ